MKDLMKTTARVTEAQVEMMRHALGSSHSGTEVGWRNNFCAAAGEADDLAWQGLVAEGLAVAGTTINEGTNRYYHVTPAGIEYVKACTKFVLQRLFEVEWGGNTWSHWGESAGKLRMDLIRECDWLSRRDIGPALKAIRVRRNRKDPTREVWP